jgi:hypothetical protein
MATFPSLTPDGRSYNFGRFAMSKETGLGGSQVKFLHSIRKSGVAMTLTYEGLTQTEMASIREHYRIQQGSVVSFLLPSTAWAGHSSVTNIVPSGTRWKYAAPPEEDQKNGGLVDVTVSLLVESTLVPGTGGGIFWPDPPTPSLVFSPNYLCAGEGTMDITVTYANFIPESTATIGEVPTWLIYVNSTQVILSFVMNGVPLGPIAIVITTSEGTVTGELTVNDCVPP